MEWLLLLAEILMINLVLSGDNAVVIAMASKNLPPIQRKRAVWWGAALAVLLRLVLTWIAAILLQVPFIQACGAILLAGIAFKLLLEQEDHTRLDSAATLWSAVRTILAADFVMSLDNVLAIAALAEGDVAVLVIGIAVSIPIVVWGSNLIAEWLQRLPILVFVGAGILSFTAGKMLMHDPKLGPLLTHLTPSGEMSLPFILVAIVLAVGGWHKFVAIKR